MPDLAITAIRKAIKLGVESIRKSNSVITAWGTYTYLTTVRKVSDPPVNYDQIEKLPHVNLFMGRELNANVRTDTRAQMGQNKFAMYLGFELLLECWLGHADNPALERDKMRADLQVYFGHNYWIPDSIGGQTISGTVFDSEYASSNPWEEKKDTHVIIGIDMMFRIWYNLRNSDPYNLAL